MRYMGSKNRIAKHILPIMLAERTPGQWWVEPFVGGANMIDKVDGNRIGSDSNKYLIALLKQMQLQVPFRPPHIGEHGYKEIQHNKDAYPDWLVGYAGFNLSFAAKFFGGYARDKAGIRNHENEALQNLLAQQKLLAGVRFMCGDYRHLNIPPRSLVYCDPPYSGTTRYKDKLDHRDFYVWCAEKADEGHTVFLSEYSAPPEFECIFEKEVASNLDVSGKGKKETEKLFRYRK